MGYRSWYYNCKEAGGQVNDLNLKQNNNINIIASSSSINEKLLKNLINF